MDRPWMLTIGHSTHSAERFLELLHGSGVAVLADVRRHPGSKRMPHFNAGELARALPPAGIEYVGLGDELGGMRRSPGSGASGRTAAFAAYEDHMRSAEFGSGIARLEALARRRPTAFMCAEGDWRRCHRSLIADALDARGWQVLHIRPDGTVEEHGRTGLAEAAGQGRLLAD